MQLTAFLLFVAIIYTRAQFTVINNCTEAITVYTKVVQGESPLKDGELIASGQQIEIDVDPKLEWLGSFVANDLRNGDNASFWINNPSQAHYYWGNVDAGFNLPLQIRPLDSDCPVVTCLERPSKECANSKTDVAKVHLCPDGTDYEIIFCPKVSSEREDMEMNFI